MKLTKGFIAVALASLPFVAHAEHPPQDPPVERLEPQGNQVPDDYWQFKQNTGLKGLFPANKSYVAASQSKEMPEFQIRYTGAENWLRRDNDRYSTDLSNIRYFGDAASGLGFDELTFNEGQGVLSVSRSFGRDGKTTLEIGYTDEVEIMGEKNAALRGINVPRDNDDGIVFAIRHEFQ